MTLRYKLHHIGLLCANPEASLAFYRDVLKHGVVARFYSEGDYDLTFLGSGSELLIELVGEPFSGLERAHLAKFGSSLHHIAFEVADVDVAFAELRGAGLRVAWEPEDFLFVRHCGVFDDCGVIVEILQEKVGLPRPGTSPSTPPYLLHHFDLFSDNWQRTKAFYAKHFGLTSLFEYIYEGGGAFIYLTDSYFDPDTRQAVLEVIGPPYVEPREFAFAQKHHTGIDHIGYVVPHVQQAYQNALVHGSPDMHPPYQGYGTEMGWIQDADGNDLELMLPLDKEKLQQAFQTGKPHQPNVVRDA